MILVAALSGRSGDLLRTLEGLVYMLCRGWLGERYTVGIDEVGCVF